MKNIKSLLLLLIITSFGFSSCQKDIVFVEGSGPGGTKPTTYTTKMSAKVDGVLIECEFAYAQQYTNSDGTKDIQIYGIKSAQSFILDFQNFKGVGTYNAADLISSGTYVSGVNDPFNNGHYAESGTIKVTTYDSKVIIGTFEFKAVNTIGEIKNITEGQFVISLEPIPGPEPGETGNMNAKIDGTKISFTTEAVLMLNSPLGKSMSIIGSNGVKTMSLSIYDFKGVGTYPVPGSSQCFYNEDQSQTGSFYSENSGKVVITSANGNKIKGTFEFEAPNQDQNLNTKRNITEGKFEVTYITL